MNCSLLSAIKPRCTTTSRDQPLILSVLGRCLRKVRLSLFLYIYYSKNEEDLERSHDMLQRELRALLEMEGKNRLIVTDVILKGAFQLGGKKSQVRSMARPNV